MAVIFPSDFAARPGIDHAPTAARLHPRARKIVARAAPEVNETKRALDKRVASRYLSFPSLSAAPARSSLPLAKGNFKFREEERETLASIFPSRVIGGASDSAGG